MTTPESIWPNNGWVQPNGSSGDKIELRYNDNRSKLNKNMADITLFDFMEDFDNSELSDYERDEQLLEAVRDYNNEYGTDYTPKTELRNYKIMLRRRKLEEPTE